MSEISIDVRVKRMRLETGLSQTKFCGLFGIPVKTYRDWEQGRRLPCTYVIDMMDEILRLKGLVGDDSR